MQQQPSENTNKFGNWLKNSITARMLMVGFLTLLLLIPLAYIQDLIRERSNRQKDVVKEINQTWGEEVLLYGPVLQIPYKTFQEKVITDEKTKKVYSETIEEIHYAYFFPEELDITGTVQPEEKAYGIYKAAVYETQLQLTGTFTQPDFKELEIPPKQVIWEKARILLQTSNLKGVNNKVAIQLNDSTYSFKSKYTTKGNSYNKVTLHTLESKTLGKKEIPKQENVSFTMQLDIKGSQQIRFIPIGKTTTAELQSKWKNPNFFGEFLPYNNDKITENGFDAKWKVLDINRAFSQEHANYLPDLQNYAFGVNFIIPVDEYQKSERSTKYGFLVIGLTFLIFFLIQTMSKIPIHAFQYLMIGLALTMFYTLLVSISEHSSFSKAYTIAGFSVVTLITLYSQSILKSKKFATFIGISLTLLYTFIYVIIQLENYALLVGSIGLFAILAAVMYASRKIDWNNN